MELDDSLIGSLTLDEAIDRTPLIVTPGTLPDTGIAKTSRIAYV